MQRGKQESKKPDEAGESHSPYTSYTSYTPAVKNDLPTYCPKRGGAGNTFNKSVRVQQPMDTDRIIRTKNGCFEPYSSAAWGDAFIPVIDLDAEDITEDEAFGIRLIPNFPRIPAHLWSRWVSLAFHLCPGSSSYHSTHRSWNPASSTWSTKVWDPTQGKMVEKEFKETGKFGFGSLAAVPGPEPKPRQSLASWLGDDDDDDIFSGSGAYSGSNLEVSCLLLRKQDDLSQWRILVPRQEVSGGRVEAVFDVCVDIETGEIIKDQFPPPGWVHAGSSHSHNTMGAYFSGTDDENELGVPGLHIVVGSISKYLNEYSTATSIVLRQQRKKIPFDDVVDHTPVKDVAFHPNALLVISKLIHGRAIPSKPSSASPASPTTSPTGAFSQKSAGDDLEEIIKRFSSLLTDEEEKTEKVGELASELDPWDEGFNDEFNILGMI